MKRHDSDDEGVMRESADGMWCLHSDLQAYALELKAIAERMRHSPECPQHSHGCTVDLYDGQEPDGCVIDDGKPHLCVYARKIPRKEECAYWKPNGQCNCPIGELMAKLGEVLR